MSAGRGWLIIAGLFDRYMELTQAGTMTTRYGRGPVMLFSTGVCCLVY